MKILKVLSLVILFFSIESFSQEMPFGTVLEEPPIYPSCKGNNRELKKCFSKNIQMHFARKFDASLVNTLELTPGKKRVFIMFRINKEGVVDSIKVKAPHVAIINECEKVIAQLPKMIPGKQRGENVNVKYTIPFYINIVESKAQRKAREKRERKMKRKKKRQ